MNETKMNRRHSKNKASRDESYRNQIKNKQVCRRREENKNKRINGKSSQCTNSEIPLPSSLAPTTEKQKQQQQILP